MRPVVMDLKDYIGKDIAVRLVDDETGSTVAAYLKESPWAHITFDHFRFHDARPFFPTEITSSEIRMLPPMDPVLHAGLSAADAAQGHDRAEGLHGQARRGRARRRAADRLRARRPRPAVGRRGAHLSQRAHPRARAATAS